VIKLKKIILHWQCQLKRELKSSFSEQHFELTKMELKHLLSGMFGYFALLYSQRAKALVGDNVVVKHPLIISTEQCDTDVCCSYHELPFASDSIDLVVLPEIMQSSRYPHQILREIERVLIPEGYMILILENPLSAISLKKRIISAILAKQATPSLFGKLRIKDWFRLLGLEVCNDIPISPLQQQIADSNWPQWFKRVTAWWSEYTSGYYIVVAKKKVSTMTPIRPSWRRNPKLVSPRFADTSVSSQVDDYLKNLK
jgi:SAM-dependent methyltransferase